MCAARVGAARVDAAGAKGVITAIGASEGGIGEYVIRLADSTLPKSAGVAVSNAVENLRMSVVLLLIPPRLW